MILGGRAGLMGLFAGLAMLSVPRTVGSSCLDADLHSAVAPEDVKMVEYKGTLYQLSIARGRWMSTQVPYEIICILLSEKMGINITRGYGSSSTDLLRQVSGCSDDSLECSEEEEAAGQFAEPPEIWAATEVWTSTEENRQLRNFVTSASFTGYLSDPGLRALPVAYTQADAAGILLGLWESLLFPSTKSCCFSDVADVLNASAELGYTSQIADGGSYRADMESLGFPGRIQDGWYLATSCKDNISACIPVVLGEFSWNMAEWVVVAENYSIPLAIAPYGWVGGAQEAVEALAARDLSFLFYWWRPDSTFESLSPKMVLFREEMLTIRQAQPLEKIVWAKILEVDEGSDILDLLSRATFSNELMDSFATRQQNESAEDIACEWLLDNEDTWSSWLPDATNCEKGFFYDNATAQCTACETGTFTPNKGMTACEACAPGSYQSQPGKTDCDSCLAGTYSGGAAASCHSCDVGQWQNETGQSSCSPCDAAGVLTTEWPGSTSEEECVCPEGTYMPLEATAALCEDCPEGMECELGSDLGNVVRGSGPFPDDQPPFPQLLSGYMTLASEPTRVFKCLPESNCLGGGTASCALMRATTQPACGECADGSYSTGGNCYECGDLDAWPFVFTSIVALVGLALVTKAVNRNLLQQSSSVIMSVVMLGLLFSGIQAMGVFKQMSIEWGGGVEAFFDMINLLSFDLEVLRPQCIVGSDSPATSFVVRQLVAPCGALFVLLVLCIKKAWVPSTSIMIELVNTVGTLTNIFFISIVTSGVSPFICYRHPSGDRSMVAASSILCFDSHRHDVMMAVGVTSLTLVPLPFLAAVGYFIIHYQGYLATSKEAHSQNALTAMRFLYFRYWARTYYYGVVLLVRSLLICLVPVVISDDVALQICVMAAIIGFMALVQQDLKPWRSRLTNFMDGAMCISLILLLLSGALVADLEADPDTVEVVGIMAISTLLISAGVGLMWALFNRFDPRRKYGFFICHHKAHAAAQARLLKMKLQKKTQRNVFIDSDNLTELDSLFDIVRCQVKHLVVYLTRETLSRPWCAGEITTAFQMTTVRVTSVRTPVFQPPTEEQLENIDTFLDLSSCTLEEYGISFDRVRNAFAKLLGSETPQLRLERNGGVHNFDVLVDCLLKSRKASSDTIVSMTHNLDLLPKDLERPIVICSDHGDMEAVAAATILNAMITEQVLSVGGKATVHFHDYQQEEAGVYGRMAKSSSATVVLLSRGTMRSATQLQVIVDLMTGGDHHADGSHPPPRSSEGSDSRQTVDTKHSVVKRVTAVPVLIDGFIFPDDHYYQEDLPRILGPELAQEASPLIHSFFKTIAVSLSTSASENLLMLQAKQIATRALPEEWLKSL